VVEEAPKAPRRQLPKQPWKNPLLLLKKLHLLRLHLLTLQLLLKLLLGKLLLLNNISGIK
jgi:hypothetical protein